MPPSHPSTIIYPTDVYVSLRISAHRADLRNAVCFSTHVSIAHGISRCNFLAFAYAQSTNLIPETSPPLVSAAAAVPAGAAVAAAAAVAIVVATVVIAAVVVAAVVGPAVLVAVAVARAVSVAVPLAARARPAL